MLLIMGSGARRRLAPVQQGPRLVDSVRHEALLNRVVVKGHRRRLVAAGRFEAEGSPTWGRQGGWEAPLTKPGRASTATPSGLPVAYALTSATTDERDTALAMIHLDPDLAERAGQVMMGDKGYRSVTFESELNAGGITLIRPSLKSEKTTRPLQQFLKPFRQIIESVNQTFKAQLDLERHGARKPAGVCARILQRILALTAAIWHNETTNQPGPARSLLAYDH